MPASGPGLLPILEIVAVLVGLEKPWWLKDEDDTNRALPTDEKGKEFQPELPKQQIDRKPLTESDIRALFEPVRERMLNKGYREDQIRARWEKFRKRQRDAEGAA